jgi:hypothetical protein
MQAEALYSTIKDDARNNKHKIQKHIVTAKGHNLSREANIFSYSPAISCFTGVFTTDFKQPAICPNSEPD